jgi:tol-pal system protein YbgF
MCMRHRLALLIAVALVGCSGPSKPTFPVAASTDHPTDPPVHLAGLARTDIARSDGVALPPASTGSSSPALDVAELPPPADAPPAEDTAGDPKSVLPTGDPAILYNRAFGLLRSGDWKGAAEALEEFVHQYPRDGLTSSAHYWLGEAYVMRGDNDRAVTAFADAYSADPNGARAPYALYKLSLALERAGRIEEACRVVEPLRRAYPLDANRSGEIPIRCR